MLDFAEKSFSSIKWNFGESHYFCSTTLSASHENQGRTKKWNVDKVVTKEVELPNGEIRIETEFGAYEDFERVSGDSVLLGHGDGATLTATSKTNSFPRGQYRVKGFLLAYQPNEAGQLAEDTPPRGVWKTQERHFLVIGMTPIRRPSEAEEVNKDWHDVKE